MHRDTASGLLNLLPHSLLTISSSGIAGGGLFIGEKDQSVVAVHACQCAVAVLAEKLPAWNVLCIRLDTQYQETAFRFTAGRQEVGHKEKQKDRMEM